MEPKVTIFMTVYNGKQYLREAVESILAQTFDDFELLLLDDCSTDQSQEILMSFRDSRIRIVENKINLGRTPTLNAGLRLARGKYIAIQDQDDLSLPTRVEVQVDFLENHPEIGLVGSNTTLISADGRLQIHYDVPVDDVAIRWKIMLSNTFSHSSVMLRRDVLKYNSLNYNENFKIAQDYGLWVDMLRYTQGANINQPLVKYRVYPQSYSSQQMTLMLTEHRYVARQALRAFLPEFDLPDATTDLLVGMLISRPKFFSSIQNQRVSLANFYLDMFDAFVKHYPVASTHRELRYNVALDVFYAVLYPPVPAGWFQVFQRAKNLEKDMLIQISRRLPSLIYRNWRFRQLRS